MLNLSYDLTELHSKIRDINIECDKLVIGSTLESLVYCFLNNLPMVCTHLQPPFSFEHFDVDDDLSVFGIQNIEQKIRDEQAVVVGEVGFPLISFGLVFSF